MLLVSCPKCKSKLQIPDELLGKVVACSNCQTRMQLPPPRPVSPTPAIPNLTLDEPATPTPPVSPPVPPPTSTPTLAPVQQSIAKKEPPLLNESDLVEDDDPDTAQDDVILLDESHQVEEDESPRVRQRPAHQSTPEAPPSSDNPFAFDETDASGSDAEGSSRSRPGKRRRTLIGTRASRWLATAAAMDVPWTLITIVLGVFLGAGIVGPGIGLILLMFFGSTNLTAYRNKVVVILAALAACLIGLGFLLGTGYMGLVLLRSLTDRTLPTSNIPIILVILAVCTGYTYVHVMAAITTFTALGSEEVQEAFQASIDRDLDEQDEEDRRYRRQREREEDEYEDRRRRSRR